MTAVRRGGNEVSIGRDFVEATTGKAVWMIEALGYGFKFVVNLECPWEDALKLVRNVMRMERIKPRGFIWHKA